MLRSDSIYSIFSICELWELTRSWVLRSFAVFDSLVAHCAGSVDAAAAVSSVSPQPLTTVSWAGAALTDSWPANAEGNEIRAGCQEPLLCLYQAKGLRSVVAVLVCAAERFVVWLSVESAPETVGNGFADATDAALAQQKLYESLELLTKLEWLETV